MGQLPVVSERCCSVDYGFVLHLSILEAQNVRHMGSCEVQCGTSVELTGPGHVVTRRTGQNGISDRAYLAVYHGSTDPFFDLLWIPPAQIALNMQPGETKLRFRLISNDEKYESLEKAENLTQDVAIVNLSEVLCALYSSRRKIKTSSMRFLGPDSAAAEDWLSLSGGSDGHLLVRYGVDAKTLRLWGDTDTSAFKTATRHDAKMVEKLESFLQTQGLSDVNDHRPTGETVLHLALRNNDMGLIWQILSRSDFTAINSSDTIYNQTPLHLAAERGNAAVITAILDRPEFDSISRKDVSGKTALHLAVWHNHMHACSALLRSKAPLANEVDNHGATPLHYAAKRGNEAICRLLLGCSDCQPSAQDDFGNTATSLATAERHAEVLKALRPYQEAGKTPSSIAPSTSAIIWNDDSIG